MSYIPATLRIGGYHVGGNTSTRQPCFDAAGVCGLPIAKQRRLLTGLAHSQRLGLRAQAELVLEIIRDRLDLDAALQRLDDYQRLTPEMVQAAGADRFPPRQLDVVPR
jgi:hypothetical protein